MSEMYALVRTDPHGPPVVISLYAAEERAYTAAMALNHEEADVPYRVARFDSQSSRIALLHDDPPHAREA